MREPEATLKWSSDCRWRSNLSWHSVYLERFDTSNFAHRHSLIDRNHVGANDGNISHSRHWCNSQRTAAQSPKRTRRRCRCLVGIIAKHRAASVTMDGKQTFAAANAVGVLGCGLVIQTISRSGSGRKSRFWQAGWRRRNSSGSLRTSFWQVSS